MAYGKPFFKNAAARKREVVKDLTSIENSKENKSK